MIVPLQHLKCNLLLGCKYQEKLDRCACRRQAALLDFYTFDYMISVGLVSAILLRLKQSVLGYTPKRTESVFPTDFLSFFVSTSVVRNSYFVDANLLVSRNLSCYFWFETKTVFFQRKTLNDINAEHLVTCLHISKVQIGKHV